MQNKNPITDQVESEASTVKEAYGDFPNDTSDLDLFFERGVDRDSELWSQYSELKSSIDEKEAEYRAKYGDEWRNIAASQAFNMALHNIVESLEDEQLLDEATLKQMLGSIVHGKNYKEALKTLNDVLLSKGLNKKDDRVLAIAADIARRYVGVHPRLLYKQLGEESIDEAAPTPGDLIAQAEGKKAAKAGKKYDENPYDKGTSRHLQWSKGHNAARAKMMKEEDSIDEMKKWKKEDKKLDPVGKEDDDVDNDGDVDSSDDYLKNRRKAISKEVNESKMYVVMDKKTGKAVSKPMSMEGALDSYDSKGGAAKGMAVVAVDDKRLKEGAELEEAILSPDEFMAGRIDIKKDSDEKLKAFLKAPAKKGPGSNNMRKLVRAELKRRGVNEAELEELDEARGTAAKYADRKGIMGDKYDSMTHSIGTETGEKWRDDRRAKRHAEHQKQDPKHAKAGYAKNMVDVDKAKAKAAKRGVDTSKMDTYTHRNGLANKYRKLPEGSTLADYIALAEGAIEIEGIMGLKNKPFRKKFKSEKELEKWFEKNEGNVEILRYRDLDESLEFEDFKSLHEAKIKIKKGDKERMVTKAELRTYKQMGWELCEEEAEEVVAEESTEELSEEDRLVVEAAAGSSAKVKLVELIAKGEKDGMLTQLKQSAQKYGNKPVLKAIEARSKAMIKAYEASRDAKFEAMAKQLLGTINRTPELPTFYDAVISSGMKYVEYETNQGGVDKAFKKLTGTLPQAYHKRAKAPM